MVDDGLNNDWTLENYNIQHGTVLELRHWGMQIFARSISGKFLTLQVTPRHTVGDLKRMIENRTGWVPPHHNALIYHGSVLRDDHLTLGDHEIET